LDKRSIPIGARLILIPVFSAHGLALTLLTPSTQTVYGLN